MTDSIDNSTTANSPPTPIRGCEGGPDFGPRDILLATRLADDQRRILNFGVFGRFGWIDHSELSYLDNQSSVVTATAGGGLTDCLKPLLAGIANVAMEYSAGPKLIRFDRIRRGVWMLELDRFSESALIIAGVEFVPGKEAPYGLRAHVLSPVDGWWEYPIRYTVYERGVRPYAFFDKDRVSYDKDQLHGLRAQYVMACATILNDRPTFRPAYAFDGKKSLQMPWVKIGFVADNFKPRQPELFTQAS